MSVLSFYFQLKQTQNGTDQLKTEIEDNIFAHSSVERSMVEDNNQIIESDSLTTTNEHTHWFNPAESNLKT